MNRLTGLAATACILLSLTLAGIARAAAPSSAPAAASQPTVIPGDWKLTDQPLPPLDKVVGKGAGPVYGLYTWAGEYRANRDSIKKVGWKSFRVGGPITDDDMKMFVEDGVEILMTLQVQSVLGADWSKSAKKSRADFASDDEFIAAYMKAIEAFLQRYGPDGTFFKDNPNLPKRPILFVEIWNEPNFQYMVPDSNDRKKDNAQRDPLYAKALLAAYQTIKKRWPAVSVVGFGAGGASADDLRFIPAVLKIDPNVAKSFDILSTHPYVEPVPPETDCVRSWGSYSIAKGLDKIRKTLTDYGVGDKPIWYTEMGWPISKADGGFFEMNQQPYVSPLLQAAYVCRTYAYAMRLGVQRVHIMFVTDSDNFNAGFFLRDGSWRPSAKAVQTMIKTLESHELTRVISDGENGYYAYSFRDNSPTTKPLGPPMLMVWNVGGPKTVEISLDPGWAKFLAKTSQTDMLGNEKDLPVKDGKVTVEVGPLPIYITD